MPEVDCVKAHAAWPFDRIADHDVGEVGREDEGGDDGEEGLVGPVEQRPAELAELRGFL